MKDIKTLINEGKASELFSEVQNEEEKNAEYHTFNISKGKKKFKKGFLTFNEENEFFTITAFNDLDDLVDMLGGNKEDYEEYDEIEIGEAGESNDNDNTISQILRIW